MKKDTLIYWMTLPVVRSWRYACLLAGASLLLGLPPLAHGQLTFGDVLVADANYGDGVPPTYLGALVRVNPVSGSRTILSDFNVGPNLGGGAAYSVAVEATGQILVLDAAGGSSLRRGQLFRVNPSTGARTIVSDFGVGANPGFVPSGLAVEASGKILVTALNPVSHYQLFRVDPVSGSRTVLSDFSVGANPAARLSGIAVEATGQILVTAYDAGTFNQGALFRVNPSTGARTLLSDFRQGANQGIDPRGVAVEATGQILVIAGTLIIDATTAHNQGVLFRVNPVTGARTVVSDFAVGANQGVVPANVAVEANGQILVTDNKGFGTLDRVVFRVDPVTGARTVLANFNDGPAVGHSPQGVVVMLLNRAPAAICQDVTVPAGAGCSATASINNGSFDPDAGDSITLSQSPAGPYPLGRTTVTLTVTDSHGKSAQCTARVTVVDTIAPVMTACPANLTVGTVGNKCSGPATWTAPTAQDTCAGPITVKCTPSSGSSFNLGTTTVTCTASDGVNVTSCSFTVRVVDTGPPKINCPAKININTDPGQCVAANVSYGVTATDNCDPNPVLSCIPPSGSTFSLGGTPVMCTAIDVTGNSSNCTFIVTVSDKTPPTISCPANRTVECVGPTGTPVAYTVNLTDICDPHPILSCNKPSGNTFPPGVSTVTCTATDASGNRTNCSFTITVIDTTPPVITCPADPTIECSSPNGTRVTFSLSVTDNCDRRPTVSCTPPSGSIFAAGPTLVNCIVTDSSNNNSTCSFTVRVVDTTAPKVRCPANITSANDPSQCSAILTYTATATDNCDASPTVSCSPPSGSTFPLGDTTVTCTATDHSGYMDQCTFRVRVVELILPTITCPADQTVECLSPAGTPVTYAVVARDNCDPNPTVSCTPASGSTFPMGTTTVRCTATDASQNIGRCSFLVKVVDTTAPTITCPADFTVSTDPGQCSKANVTYTATATDNRDLNPSITCVPPSGSSFALGTTTVRCTAKDAKNNNSSCAFIVTVVDGVAPTITCPADITVSADAAPCAKANVTYTATATDNCDPNPTISCTPPSGSTFSLGTTTVTCTAADTKGNNKICTFTVTVTDNTRPTINCPAGITVNTDPGQCSKGGVTYTATATDTCDPNPTVSCTPSSGSTFPSGSTTVTCTATDASGNVATCSFTVTVSDNEPPTATCPGLITVNTAPGACDAVATYTATATDNCDPSPAISCTPPSGSTFSFGTTPVTCTATDAQGNHSSCSFNVRVVHPASGSGPLSFGDILVADADYGPSFLGALVRVDPASGSRTVLSDFGSGPNPGSQPTRVAVEATGQILVLDLYLNKLFRVDPSSGARTIVSDLNAGDNRLYQPLSLAVEASGQILVGDGYLLARIDPTTGSRTILNDFSVGLDSGSTLSGIAVEATGQILVAASYGGTFNQGALFRVDPLTGARTILSDFHQGANQGIYPKDVAVDATGQIWVIAGILVIDQSTQHSQGVLFRVDPSTGARTVVSDFAVGANQGHSPAYVAVEPNGQILVTDNRGFQTPEGRVLVRVDPSSGDRTVLSTFYGLNPQGVAVVYQNTTHIITCPPNLTVSADPGHCEMANVTYTVTVTDPCDPNPTISCTPPSGSAFPVGLTTVNCTATDASGSTDTCSFTITVNDEEKPTATCPAPITLNAASGTCDAVVSYTASVSDNCPGATISCAPASGSPFPKGTTSVNCTASDASGNTATCSFIVTVNDNEPPTATCPAPITLNAASGTCDAVVSYTASASDNCPGATISCAPASGSPFPKGTTSVNCTASDASGNTSSCTFTVTVTDDSSPMITCPANLTASPDPGQCSTATVTYNVTATDNCNPNQAVICAPPSGSTFLPGTTTVTCTATDASGNSSSCTFTVTLGTPITACPIHINAPGLYFLAADLALAGTSSDPPAIGIGAQNVCLDLNGHTLSGPNSDCSGSARDGIVLNSLAVNVRIYNGTLKGFRFGMVIAGSSHLQIDGLTVTKNSTGILMGDGAHDNHINTNDISGNCETGVFLGSAHHNEFIRNKVNTNGFGGGGAGFLLISTDDTVITDNEISGNTGSGVRLFAGADGNILRGNTANGNSSDGIRVDCGSIANVVEGNTVDSLGPFAADLTDYNLSPPCVNGCVNTWNSNVFLIDNESGTDFGPGVGCIR